MFPMDRKPTPVTVQYTSRGIRVSKRFADAYTARRFYVAKDRAGANPRIVAASEEVDTMAKKTTTTTAPAATKATSNGTHDGTAVGYLAKCQRDCKWNATRVAFYKALRKIGEGTAQQISEASKGEVSVGNCLNYGYHGVTPGLNKVEEREGVKGFVFVVTAKGRKLDLDKVLTKKDKE